MALIFSKYFQTFLLGLQSGLVYRWNFAVRSCFYFFHLAVVFVLWRAAFDSSPNIGGFAFGPTLTYFLTLVLLQFFIGAFNEDYQISEEIRNGLINQFLLKPVNYFLYRSSLFAAARIISGVLVLVPLAVAFPLLWHYLCYPEGAWRIAFGLPAMAMAASIQFTIAYCFGLLTFWFLDIQGFVILSLAVEQAFGGLLFPLDLLPPAIFRASQWLPFYYQMYFPAAIVTGRISRPLAAQGLVFQACWVVVLLGIGRLLWHLGLRRHTAVGG